MDAIQPRGLTIFDLAIPAGLWWWWSVSGWASVGSLALGVSAWVIGMLAACCRPVPLRLLGGQVQWCGGIVGCVALPWLLLACLQWVWLRWI